MICIGWGEHTISKKAPWFMEVPSQSHCLRLFHSLNTIFTQRLSLHQEFIIIYFSKLLMFLNRLIMNNNSGKEKKEVCLPFLQRTPTAVRIPGFEACWAICVTVAMFYLYFGDLERKEKNKKIRIFLKKKFYLSFLKFSRKNSLFLVELRKNSKKKF